MAALVGYFVTLATGWLAWLAARFGMRVALAAGLLTMFATIFALLKAACLAAYGVLAGAWGGLGVALQFGPSSTAIATGLTLYLGALATMRVWQFWSGAMIAVSNIAKP